MAAPATVLVLGLLTPPDTLSKSYYIYKGGEKKKCTGNNGDNDNKAWILSKGLFVKGFYKYFLNNNTFKAIKKATKFI